MIRSASAELHAPIERLAKAVQDGEGWRVVYGIVWGNLGLFFIGMPGLRITSSRAMSSC